ncbi:AraC family transcriptional regulator [Modicisalibacter coralii]|uniref:AraC family transcriptional regulator n=1 Tax=Modicisalibacter coralii TaxID=2304602 RepID=UPI00100A41AF|nr:AraC family transcriptional regulator [Halomonas coralii]
MSQFWRDAALPFVESRRASHSRACYRAHSHPTLSIGVVDQGQSLFQCADQHATLTPGSLVSIPAHAVHACNPLPGRGWSYQMLYLDRAWVAHVLGDDTEGIDTTAFVGDSPTAYRAFCRLNDLLFSGASVRTKQAGLIDFLVARHWRGGAALLLKRPVATRLQAIQDHLLQSLAHPPGLTALARRHAMSRYQLIRLFRHETGLTPHAWLLDQRIQRARQRLQQGAALADLAQELGFADQGHFQRVFKARVASTPGGYRLG